MARTNQHQEQNADVEAPAITNSCEPLMSAPAWTQEAANAVAHLVQIHYRLRTSSWGDRFSIVGCSGEPVPDIETLTLPLLLLRQVIGGDRLIHKVRDIYAACIPTSNHTEFLRYHVSQLDAALSSPLPVTREGMGSFFGAILYGTCLFHAPDGDRRFDEQAALISRLNGDFSTADIMTDLKYTLDKVWFHVSESATLCALDYNPTQGGAQQAQFPMLSKVFRVVDPVQNRIRGILNMPPTTPPTVQ